MCGPCKVVCAHVLKHHWQLCNLLSYHSAVPRSTDSVCFKFSLCFWPFPLTLTVSHVAIAREARLAIKQGYNYSWEICRNVLFSFKRKTVDPFELADLKGILLYGKFLLMAWPDWKTSPGKQFKDIYVSCPIFIETHSLTKAVTGFTYPLLLYPMELHAENRSPSARLELYLYRNCLYRNW